MATNQFKPFATRPDANVTPQNEWEALPALLSGFTAGKASSAQVNKALRQASFIAAALAQFVSEKSGQDVLDDGDITAFLAKLTAGFGNQYLTRNNPFADIKADGVDAVATALENLGLLIAATSIVGNNTSTSVLSPNKNYSLLINNNGVWGAFSKSGSVPLPITSGGTGATTINDALSNFGLSAATRVKGDSSRTSVNSPNATNSLVIGDNGVWGAFAGGVAIALPVTGGGTGASTASDARQNLGIKSAALKDVGAGPGQIPDMSSWTSGGDLNIGWRKTPDGYIEQWGVSSQTTTDVQVTFPIPFTVGVSNIIEHDLNVASNPRVSIWQFTSLNANGFVAQNIGVLSRNESTMSAPVAAGCRWFARGK